MAEKVEEFNFLIWYMNKSYLSKETFKFAMVDKNSMGKFLSCRESVTFIGRCFQYGIYDGYFWLVRINF